MEGRGGDGCSMLPCRLLSHAVLTSKHEDNAGLLGQRQVLVEQGARRVKIHLCYLKPDAFSVVGDRK